MIGENVFMTSKDLAWYVKNAEEYLEGGKDEAVMHNFTSSVIIKL